MQRLHVGHLPVVAIGGRVGEHRGVAGAPQIEQDQAPVGAGPPRSAGYAEVRIARRAAEAF
ncbi:hypothetical protein, partial [Streptomyces carpinensis]|uniref:hypothetical protein n=1 Tax=Streptomyces carpinensis TaxID=66369 RepID=UPI001ABFCA80